MYLPPPPLNLSGFQRMKNKKGARRRCVVRRGNKGNLYLCTKTEKEGRTIPSSLLRWMSGECRDKKSRGQRRSCGGNEPTGEERKLLTRQMKGRRTDNNGEFDTKEKTSKPVSCLSRHQSHLSRDSPFLPSSSFFSSCPSFFLPFKQTKESS